jgi:short-subunit dehydrogenase
MTVYAGKVVVVTGASQGIGKALCLALAPQGPRLVLAARDAAALEAVAAECRARGAEAVVVPTDVGDESACRALVDGAVERYGALDVLVNNAGIGMLARFEDVTDLSLYERLMRVNYLGSVYPTYHALAGLHGVPRRTAYAATKHAQMGFFDSLRIELRATGVSVTVVAPYFVQSEIRKRSPGPDGRTVEASPVKEAEIMSADECARLVVRAMEKRQRMLVMSFKGRLGRWAKLVAPGLVDWMAAESVRKGK